MKYIGTGLSGLVGSRIVGLLSPRHSFINLSLDTGVDITQREDVMRRITGDTDSEWVLHFAAYTDVQKAESQRSQGHESAAWKVNVTATGYVAEACRQSGKRLAYIDTDYAFDGTKREYRETDEPSPLGWYAVTKTEGARIVSGLGNMGLVIRISNPYKANLVGLPGTGKTDFVHKIFSLLQAGKEVTAPDDQLFSPTFVDDLAAVIDATTAHGVSGIVHAAGSGLSPYAAALEIARTYGLDSERVKKIPFAEYFSGRAPAPRYAVLTDTRLAAYGIRMRSFEEGIKDVFRQEHAE